MTEAGEMFYVLHCAECHKFSLVDTEGLFPRKNTQDVEQKTLCCPHCGRLNFGDNYELMNASDIDQMDDVTLYRIWSGISKYIIDAHHERSLTHTQHIYLIGSCEKLLDELSKKPRGTAGKS